MCCLLSGACSRRRRSGALFNCFSPPSSRCFGVQTNNMVESFFNTLKLIVQRLTCRRIDDLILLLVYKVGRHFRAQVRLRDQVVGNAVNVP